MLELRGPVAAVVLAAGASTRMGTPKQLLETDGRSFVRAVIELARAAECAPVVVVRGAVALPPEALRGVVARENPNWHKGQLSSLQVGLAALADAGVQPSGVLVLTVDRPHVRPATARLLVRAHERFPKAILQPEHEGRRGHPILYPAAVIPALRALPDSNSPRQLLALPAVARMRRGVAVDDPAVLDNIDTPEDLARLRARDPPER